MVEKTIYSLSQLTRSVQNVIQQYSSKVVWIKAEIVKLNYYSKSGHCYPSLVEKRNGKVIAELRGNIWNSTFEIINQKFRTVLKEELSDDMSVVIQGSMTFHPVHGLALNILDIDPEYSLGELAKAKAETIEKLQSEHIFEANKAKHLSLLPKTLAVISVETSKGYQDFLNVLNTNPGNYKIHHLLFPAILQGERAVSTISEQLDIIRQHSDVFDAVAIIRGGGGEIGLSCFDDHSLSRKIATFPIPVLTGIGHSTNETVCELVSFKSFITPTKIGEFILQKFSDLAAFTERAEDVFQKEIFWCFRSQKSSLKESARLFHSLTLRSMEKESAGLTRLAQKLLSESKDIFRNEENELKQFSRIFKDQSHHKFTEQLQKITFFEEKLQLLSPENILKRGYSITRQNGKVIKNPKKIEPNVPLETTVYQGTFSSIVSTTKNKEKNEQ